LKKSKVKFIKLETINFQIYKCFCRIESKSVIFYFSSFTKYNLL